MNRRHFIKQSIYTTGGLITASLFPNYLWASEKEIPLTILHTNDVHSRIEPFPLDGSKHAGMGGAARRASIIRDVRKEAKNVLLLDAGDMFQGSPYFNYFKGEVELKTMSKMGYDAATLGPHDFEGGIENLSTQLKHANFPIITCNYDFSNTPMIGKTIPHKVFERGGLKIGILGVGIDFKEIIDESLYGNAKYLQPIERANISAEYLKKQGCDLIICLSQLGDYYLNDKVSDEILAKENFYIDLILGGHTHRFFDKPRVYKNRNRGETLINQGGWAGIQISRLDCSIIKNGKKKFFDPHSFLVRGKEPK